MTTYNLREEIRKLRENISDKDLTIERQGNRIRNLRTELSDAKATVEGLITMNDRDRSQLEEMQQEIHDLKYVIGTLTEEKCDHKAF